MERKQISATVYKDKNRVFVDGDRFQLRVSNTVSNHVEHKTDEGVFLPELNETSVSVVFPPKETEGYYMIGNNVSVRLFKEDESVYMEGVFMGNLPIYSPIYLTDGENIYEVYFNNTSSGEDQVLGFGGKEYTDNKFPVIKNIKYNWGKPINGNELEEFISMNGLRPVVPISASRL